MVSLPQGSLDRCQDEGDEEPAPVAKELKGRPCSNASGISVSARLARTVPPANARAKARVVSVVLEKTAYPNTLLALLGLRAGKLL